MRDILYYRGSQYCANIALTAVWDARVYETSEAHTFAKLVHDKNARTTTTTSFQNAGIK